MSLGRKEGKERRRERERADFSLWFGFDFFVGARATDNSSLAEIKQTMFEVLVVLSKSHSSFIEVRLLSLSLSPLLSFRSPISLFLLLPLGWLMQDELRSLVDLDKKIFSGLYEGTKKALSSSS